MAEKNYYIEPNDKIEFKNIIASLQNFYNKDAKKINRSQVYNTVAYRNNNGDCISFSYDGKKVIIFHCAYSQLVQLKTNTTAINQRLLQDKFNIIAKEYPNAGSVIFNGAYKSWEDKSVGITYNITQKLEKEPLTSSFYIYLKNNDSYGCSKGKDINKIIDDKTLEAEFKKIISNVENIKFKNYIIGNVAQDALLTLDLNKLENTVNKNLSDFKKKYSQHPYRDQIIQAAEENMKGNKYIKVGNQAYKEAFEYYKKAAMSILKTLREADATVSLADLRDVSDSKIKDGVNLVDRIYKTPSNQKWESRDFLDAVQAAREGDQTAIGFLMYKHAPMIINTYWRNFLGPNPKMRKVRIEEDGGLKSSILGWIGICLKALIKGGVDITKKNGNERHKFSTLEGFDESKVTGKPENAFASHFRMDVIEQAKVYNTMNDANGVSNADTPVSMTDLEFDNGRERTDGEDDTFAREGLEDSVLDKLSKDDFLKNWFDYAQDETLNDGKKCTPAAALWKLLTNPDATNLKAVAEEMGVSRGTFETLVKKAISIMPQYDIEYSDLMSACDRYGTAKIASYLAH